MADAPIPVPAPAEYKDRSTGLLVAGVIEICLGVLAALAVPLVILTTLAARRGSASPLPLAAILPSILFYVFAAVFFLLMGIGSIQARRWARALMLIACWIWLIVGILGTALAIFILPERMQTAAQGRPMPPALMASIVTGLIVFVAIFYVVLPLGLLLFYRSPHVRETCNRRDPVERWTDRAPLPILGLSLVAGYFACTYVVIGFFRPVLPLFRWVLVGISAQLACLVFAFLWMHLAISTFRRESSAWWLTLGVLLFTGASTVVAFWRGGFVRYYEKTGMGPQELELMQRAPLLWVLLAAFLILLGYVVCLRRYFIHATPARQ